jgi:hypothetical protein
VHVGKPGAVVKGGITKSGAFANTNQRVRNVNGFQSAAISECIKFQFRDSLWWSFRIILLSGITDDLPRDRMDNASVDGIRWCGNQSAVAKKKWVCYNSSIL